MHINHLKGAHKELKGLKRVWESLLSADLFEEAFLQVQPKGKAWHDLLCHCMAFVHEADHMLPASSQSETWRCVHEAVCVSESKHALDAHTATRTNLRGALFVYADQGKLAGVVCNHFVF